MCMRFPSLGFAPKQVFRSDFRAEWFGVGVFLSFAAIWAYGIHFSLIVRWHDLLLPCCVVVAIVIAHVLRSERASLVAEYFLLTTVATAVFGLLSYLSMTTGRPLVDGALFATDRDIGFDWLANYRWLLHHALTAKVFEIAYDSLVYQGLYFGVIFGLMGRREQMREMFWLVAVSGLFTCVGAALFPAFGPFKLFGVKAEFLPVMAQLRSGTLRFALTNMTGVVSFPSFHTTMALLYVYGFRRTGAIGWLIAGLNAVMILAIPFFGGHYLVDMLGGGSVALASFAIVRPWPIIASMAVSGREYAAINSYSPFEGSAASLTEKQDQPNPA